MENKSNSHLYRPFKWPIRGRTVFIINELLLVEQLMMEYYLETFPSTRITATVEKGYCLTMLC